MADVPILAPALPEIFLAVAAMAIMMAGVFVPAGRALATTTALSLATLIVTGALVVMVGGGYQLALNDLFVVDRFAVFMKILVLIGSVLAIIMSQGYIQREGMARFEYPVLICSPRSA